MKQGEVNKQNILRHSDENGEIKYDDFLIKKYNVVFK